MLGGCSGPGRGSGSLIHWESLVEHFLYACQEVFVSEGGLGCKVTKQRGGFLEHFHLCSEEFLRVGVMIGDCILDSCGDGDDCLDAVVKSSDGVPLFLYLLADQRGEIIPR